MISVGGISVGGSGKTPFTNYLVKELKLRGWSPAILTRGYRRKSSGRDLVLEAGARVPSSSTGDEAQIFLRSAAVPVGIGSNRYRVAQLLRNEFPSCDVFVLDDGFQHALLNRDIDIVLIDALDPFGGEEVVPAGRLREPLEALASSEHVCRDPLRFGRTFPSHRRAAPRKLNPDAPVFRSRIQPLGWRDMHGEHVAGLPGRRAVAFCGLGNPQSFWNTLDTLGVEIASRKTFRDHHRYSSGELEQLRRQAQLESADCLVTTEKDWVNLPAGSEQVLRSKLFWLEIGFELEKARGILFNRRGAAGAGFRPHSS